MLALALIVFLAAPQPTPPASPSAPPRAQQTAPPAAVGAPVPTLASLPRVPGMRLRLGMAESQLLALGGFSEFKAPDAGPMTARRGAARFFGVPGDATCYLLDGVLEEVLFDATGVSTHSQDYVDGQLRMMLFSRACSTDLTGDRSCDWMSPRIRVHSEMKKDHLTAHVVRWPPPEDRAPDSLQAGAAAGAHAAAKSTAGATKTKASSSTPAGALGTHTQSSAPAGGTKPTSGAGHTTTGAAAATTGAAAATTTHAPSAPDSTRHAPAVVATLPETLTITPANRNSTTAWPRIVSSPPLQYPDKARQESLQGVVWVTALVDSSGKVLTASIERSIRDLDESAIAWVKGSQFAPCQKNGAPCRFVVRVAVLFTLY